MLTPGSWKPGQTGNPSGRPKKGTAFCELLDKELRHKIRVTEGGETKLIAKKLAVCRRLIAMALDGDVAALKYLMDRIDGKPDIFEHVVSGTVNLTDLPPEERTARINELLARRNGDDEA